MYNQRGHNKFYTLQLLESDSGRSFIVVYKWGRVGAKNPQTRKKPFTTLHAAKKEFAST